MKDDSSVKEDQLAKRQDVKSVSGSKGKEIVQDMSMEVEPIATEENKAMASLEIKKGYYLFGINEVFSIDVMRCFPAPSNYVYRMLNKDYVKHLTIEFIEDPRLEDILAILMPFDPSTNLPIDKLSKEDVHNVVYWIISGQHSIGAAKRLQGSQNPKVTPQLRQQFKYRRSKIILNCPPRISREISKDVNISVAKSMQKEPFLDQLMQARSQWHANGCPSKPPPGVNQTKKDFQSWKVLI